MLENVKLITDLQDYNPTPEVIDNWGIIASEFMKVDELSKALEDEYPEGITPEQLTDLLANDFDKVLGMVGLTWEEIEATPSGWNKQENCKENKKMAKELKEGLKVIAELGDYKPWSGAISTWDKIEEAGKIDDLEFMLEDMYPDGIGMTELNDLLWFEPETVFEWLGISDEEEVEESLNEISAKKAVALYKKQGFLDAEDDKAAVDALIEAGYTIKTNSRGTVHVIELERMRESLEEIKDIDISKVKQSPAHYFVKADSDKYATHFDPKTKTYYTESGSAIVDPDSLEEVSDRTRNRAYAARDKRAKQAIAKQDRFNHHTYAKYNDEFKDVKTLDDEMAIHKAAWKETDKRWKNVKREPSMADYKARVRKGAISLGKDKPETLETNEATTNTKEINKRCQEHMLSYYDSKEDLISEIKHYMADVKNHPISAWEAGKTMVEYGAFAVYYNQVRDALMEILGQTEEEVDKYSDQKQWEFYQNLIGRNASNLISGRVYI